MSSKNELNEVFDQIVLNAIDFLKESITEFKKKPKYSVIHFFSAIELFFKARLFKEHWTLILQKPELGKYADFIIGDFQSVNFVNAINRIESITNEKINNDAKACFNQIRNRRNKILHFYDPSYFESLPEDILEEIASEQCAGWYYLNYLLTVIWNQKFDEYQKDFVEIDTTMHEHKEFLKTKFQKIEKDIEILKRTEGITIKICKVCGFPSDLEIEYEYPQLKSNCRVCKAKSSYLKVVCDECENEINVYDLGAGKCNNCDNEIDLDYLIAKLGPIVDPKESGFAPDYAYCDECGHYDKSVICIDNDYEKWICLYCQTFHDQVEQCQRCGSWITGDLEFSNLVGCINCESH